MITSVITRSISRSLHNAGKREAPSCRHPDVSGPAPSPPFARRFPFSSSPPGKRKSGAARRCVTARARFESSHARSGGRGVRGRVRGLLRATRCVAWSGEGLDAPRWRSVESPQARHAAPREAHSDRRPPSDHRRATRLPDPSCLASHRGDRPASAERRRQLAAGRAASLFFHPVRRSPS